MRSHTPALATTLILVLVFSASPNFASVSGTLSAQFGSPLAVQSSQSDVGGYGDPYAQVNDSVESQLEAAYGYVSDGTLHLFFSGNLMFWIQLEGGIGHWLPLDVFIDCAPGGQHQLLANNPTLNPDFYDLKKMAGLTFDTGFAADYWLSLGGNSSPGPWPYVNAWFAALPAGGGGSGAYLGGTLPGPPGSLSGGTNPDGIEATLDDSNKLGLGHGCAAPSPMAVSTGIEWAIPLVALGDPTGCIRVCAFISSLDHSQISNQVLGPLPPGTCALTPAASTDFSSVAGAQYVTICPPTPVRLETWGRLKSIYR
jgi:hypothetical protein